MSAGRESLFDVRAELDPARKLWMVSITTNGYQWHSLAVVIADQERAERVAAFLRDELREDADRDSATTRAFMRGE